MNRFLFLVVPALCFSLTSFAQFRHGPSVKASFGTVEKFSLGAGYHFTHVNDQGWSRPGYNFYAEYLPEFKALGFSAGYQYTLAFIKVGLDAGVRTRSDIKKPYFNFMPNFGIDILALDLAIGPEIVTRKIDDKSVGFKVALKVHPTLFADPAFIRNLKKK